MKQKLCELLSIVEVRNANAMMDRTLSCLSCLTFVGDLSTDKNHVKGVYVSEDMDEEGTNCITLTCGHSICKSCFEMHSDPTSKDSLVFCEDCQSQTKNRNLRELRTFRQLCKSWKVLRNSAESMRGLLSINEES